MPTHEGEPTPHSALPAVTRYGSIIFRQRPVHDGDLFSRRHPRMSRLNRAKIFAPFAALVGFDERVRRKEVLYVARRRLDADEERALNHRLLALQRLTANSGLARANRVRVCVEYYVECADEESEAFRMKGRYETVTGVVLRVDSEHRHIVLRCDAETRAIPFADIRRIYEPSG